MSEIRGAQLRDSQVLDFTSKKRISKQDREKQTHGFIDKTERSSTFEENLGGVKSRTTDTHTQFMSFNLQISLGIGKNGLVYFSYQQNSVCEDTL